MRYQARAVVSRGLAFGHFEDREVQRSYWCVAPDTEDLHIPFASASSIRRYVFRESENVTDSLRAQFSNYLCADSGVGLQADAWSMKIGRTSYFAVIGHWIDTNMQWYEALLAFSPTHAKSTGIDYANLIRCTIDKYALHGRVRSITTDNASNNATMGKDLNESVDEIGSGIILIPCLAHVIQLAQGALMGALSCQATNDEIIRNWEDSDEADVRKILGSRTSNRARKARKTQAQEANHQVHEEYGALPCTLLKVWNAKLAKTCSRQCSRQY
jgi:hypothetical protein